MLRKIIIDLSQFSMAGLTSVSLLSIALKDFFEHHFTTDKEEIAKFYIEEIEKNSDLVLDDKLNDDLICAKKANEENQAIQPKKRFVLSKICDFVAQKIDLNHDIRILYFRDYSMDQMRAASMCFQNKTFLFIVNPPHAYTNLGEATAIIGHELAHSKFNHGFKEAAVSEGKDAGIALLQLKYTFKGLYAFVQKNPQLTRKLRMMNFGRAGLICCGLEGLNQTLLEPGYFYMKRNFEKNADILSATKLKVAQPLMNFLKTRWRKILTFCLENHILGLEINLNLHDFFSLILLTMSVLNIYQK